MKKIVAAYSVLLFFSFCVPALCDHCNAQGTWAKINAPSPDYNDGVMLLLTDGSVMVKSSHGGIDTLGDLWDKLTPDTTGSYVNGTWSTLSSMSHKRLYCSSQVLKNGSVYVAGGEFGNGGLSGEIYNPVTNTWIAAGPMPLPDSIFDGNSELLPDGKVLQAFVEGGSSGNFIYDPASNSYTNGPSCLGNHDESAWVKLPDSSILMVDLGSTNSERYIPKLNAWIRDATVPVALYDPFGFESGAGFLLPAGRAFFLGATGHTAYYTPSGSTSPGTWAAGPDIPNSQGTPDAAAAMMADGNILCAVSPIPTSANHFPSPTSFYEFNYLTNSFTQVSAPFGGDTMSFESYGTMMLCLPDGHILFTAIDSNQYYEYIPAGTAVVSGKPVVNNIIKQDCSTYFATGKLFNGISEGAAYGDDWQMATNYPLIRLVQGSRVYYARTYNWNSTGVMRGSLPDTTTFALPPGLPQGTYELRIVANGIASDPVTFKTCNATGVTQLAVPDKILSVFPNPAHDEVTIAFTSQAASAYRIRLIDMVGRELIENLGQAMPGTNTHQLQLRGIDKGCYMVVVEQGGEAMHTRIIVY